MAPGHSEHRSRTSFGGRSGMVPCDRVQRVPSTRDLARQLGVSRRVVVDAYAQLAAEGYLSLRQGARPRVSDAAAVASEAAGGGGAGGAARAIRLPSQRA